MESELFGYVKGAYTGAQRDKQGKFKIANNGTIFLDEIGELPLELQSKLLRVLQEQQIDVIGAEAPTQINVRIVAATNRNLEELIKEGRFREDLFYRINVVPIRIPPLRDRPDDILLLFKHFMRKFAPGEKINYTDNFLSELKAYPWKGNVRELENLVNRMLLLRNSDTLDITDLPWKQNKQTNTESKISFNLPPEGISFEDFQKELILKALKLHNGNQSKTADYLKIPRHVLLYRMDKFGLKK